MDEMFEKLREHLLRFKRGLKGAWVGKRAGYDGYICKALKMKLNKGRYWDAEWNGGFLEFKKGKSIWLDLVRYSEILLGVSPEASAATLTVFFVPTKYRDRIDEIIVVDTKRLIEKLRLTEDMACGLIELNKQVPRSLNAQASLTLNDVKGISRYVV